MNLFQSSKKPISRPISFFLFLFLLFPTLSGRAETFDRILATVDNEIFTLYDINVYNAFRIVMDGDLTKEYPLQSSVESLVNSYIEKNEALKFGISLIDDSPIDPEIESFKDKVGAQVFADYLKENHLTEEILSLKIKDYLISKEFLRRRIGELSKPSFQEIREFYENNREMFGNEKFEDVKGKLEVIIESETYSQRYNSWLSEAKERYSIKIFETEGN